VTVLGATGSVDVYAHRLDRGNGSGRTVALVHGIGDSWRGWSALAERLDDSWRIFALDFPWRSTSDVGWRAAVPPEGWIARGLAGLDAPPDVVIGHSFGATALLHLLVAVPASVRAAVLLAPAYLRPDSDRPTAEHCRSLVEQTVLELVREHIRGDEGAERLARIIAPDVWRRFATSIIAAVDATRRLPLGEVTLPALVVADPADPVLADDDAVALARAMPGARLVFKRDVGHFFHRRNPAAVAPDIHVFLTEHFSQPTHEVDHITDIGRDVLQTQGE
jgi:pimeloyl-ACP methyl ester carboxylesterase